jgi:hypothetical protein
MRAAVTDGSVVFTGPLSAGFVAYVDSDQLPRAGDAEIEALVVPDGSPVDDGGALALGALAAGVRDALAGVELAGPIDVVGAGIVAQALRAEQPAGRRPSVVVVDLTGEPSAIVDALHRVEDGGAVLLAGNPAGRPAELDFYPDVHFRGLRVIGVPPVGRAEEPSGAYASTSGVEAPAQARVGGGVPLGAPWYRVSP